MGPFLCWLDGCETRRIHKQCERLAQNRSKPIGNTSRAANGKVKNQVVKRTVKTQLN